MDKKKALMFFVKILNCETSSLFRGIRVYGFLFLGVSPSAQYLTFSNSMSTVLSCLFQKGKYTKNNRGNQTNNR